jgi:hypothetical protein
MIEIQLLVSRVEPWFPTRPSKVFAIQLPFYIVIKHVKIYIYPISNKIACEFHYAISIVHFHYAFLLCNFHYAFPLIHGVSNFKLEYCEQTSRIAQNFMGIS